MKITDEQLRHLRASFKKYDSDGNNLIDKQEMVQVLVDLGVANPEKEVDVVMMKLDSNKDGTISFAEFLNALKTINSLKEVEVDDIVAEISHPHKQSLVQSASSLFSKVVADAEAIEKTLEAEAEKISEEIVKEVAAITKPYGSSPHEFVWRYEGSHVDLVGDFTNWGAKKLPMVRSPTDGHFYLVVDLTPGVYEYKFIIDNNYEWYYDIVQPNELNTGSWFINNVIRV